MTSEPCPECKGRCCIDQEFGYPVEHMGAEFYEHRCDLCFAGTLCVPPRSAADERLDVLDLLRQAARFPKPTLALKDYLEVLISIIEEGKHEGRTSKQVDG